MSDQQQGDYPSPTASQSGPYPHRPTVATDAQLARQLSQAMDQHTTGASEYSRPHSSVETASMPWATSTPPQQHAMAAPAPPTQYAYAPDIQQQMTPNQASPGDDEPSKKKQKTSRACDECRRKKIKCDGDGEKPGYKCANCLRTSAECLYTKPAQKRGPSRGYIRELSDRVASLEELRVGMSPMTPQNPSSIFADGADGQGTKRTHSISEHGQSESVKTPFSATVSTPSIAPFARMGQSANHADGATHGSVHFKMSFPSVSQPLTPTERSDLTEFISVTKTRFPILPDDIKDTEQLLDAANGPIRDTFFRCLKAVLTLPASSDRSPYKQAFTSALELAQRPESVSPLANVVHLQVCVLLLYISGTYGPINPHTIDEPNEKILYGTAQGIASVLRLTSGSMPRASDPADGLATKQGRRAYGLFHYLSAWNSLAHGHTPYAPAQDFVPDALDGRSAISDGFLFSAMVPDLASFKTRFAKRTTYTEFDSLFFDGVILGLGIMNTELEKLDAGVRVGKSCLEILRVIAESSGSKSVAVPPRMLQAAAEVVSAYASDPAPFFLAGHHTLGLAVRVMGLASKHSETREKADAAFKETRALLDSGKFLHEDGWRGSIERAVRDGLKDRKGGDKPGGVNLNDLVHGGWMSIFR